MTDCSDVDRRALPGLLAGAIGLVFGVAAAVLGRPELAVGGAAGAVAAGGVAAVLAVRLRQAELDVAEAADAVTLRHLEVLTSRRNQS